MRVPHIVVAAALAVPLGGCTSTHAPPAGMQQAAEACVEYMTVFVGATDGSVGRQEGVDRMMDASVMASGAAVDNDRWSPLSESLTRLAVSMQLADQDLMQDALREVKTECDDLFAEVPRDEVP